MSKQPHTMLDTITTLEDAELDMVFGGAGSTGTTNHQEPTKPPPASPWIVIRLSTIGPWL